MNSVSPLGYAVRRVLKELVWSALHRYRPTWEKPNIAVFASRRSGSTLLMEVVAANRGISFSDQPFSLYSASQAQVQLLPLFEYGQVIAPDKDEYERLFSYLGDILGGRLVVNGPWKLWEWSHNMRSSRIVLKITDAKSIAAELARRFDLRVIVMTRHPIAQALSVERNGWDLTARAFLRNAAFVERWLGESLVEEAWAIISGPDALARRVLDWTLENLPLIEGMREHEEWLFLSYEQLVLYPDQSIDLLCRHCQLDDRDRMERQLKKPSRSTARWSSDITAGRIAAGDRGYLAHRWREEIDPEQESTLLQICRRFGLNLYQLGEDVPRLEGLVTPGTTEKGVAGEEQG